jgi:TonB-linked SusC/RagA family outer membrane protein
MRLNCGILAALLLGLVSAPAHAQGRTITGSVRDSLTGAAIAGARIGLQGGTTAVSPNAAGQFELPGVPAGEVTLQVRAVGYRRQDVRVPAGISTVDVVLGRDVFRIEEIVVTGQATGVERRNLANAVASVSAEDIGAVPQMTASLEHVLQGKVAGVDIQSNGGAPGGGLQVRLRGVTSVNADAQPLYVVDGVVMSDVAIPSNQNAVTAAAGGSNPALTQDAQVNRIADLNPADIETIEILKGASAAAIYGGRASNGVVIITTKRGRTGATRGSISQAFGVFSLSNKVGSRRFANAAEVDAQYQPGVGAANGCTASSCPFFDHEEELAGRSKLSSQSNVTISGGSGNTRYMASGTVQNDEGIIANTGFQRQSVRLNLDQRLGNRLDAGLRTNLLHTRAQRGLSNNDNSGTSFYVALAFTPSFADLRQNPDGTFPRNEFIGSNPLQTAALMQNDEDVWRFTVGTDLTWNVFAGEKSSFRAVFNGGADFFDQKNALLFPPELQFEAQDGLPGTSLLSKSDNLNLNLGVNAVHTYRGGGFRATTSAGVQYARRDLDISRITSRNLIAGQPNVNSGTNVQVNQARQLIVNLGGFAQEEVLLMDERLLLTAGLRGDRSSLNANSHKYHLYPKASASYLIARSGAGWLNELKLRAAYGESGNEPLYGQKFTPLTATNNIGGLPGLVVGATTGSATLKPERQREIEAGVDGQIAGSRISFEATAYQKNISDLLLTRTLAPSSGLVSEIFNGGKLRTRGVELGVGIVPVQTSAMTWYFRTTFSANRSKITELPVPAFETGGFGTSLGAFRIELGKSATQIVGNDTLPDGRDTVRTIGDANPDFRMAFISDLTWKNWGFHVLADWQQGSEILNLTRLLYDFGGVTEDFADPIPGSTETVGGARLSGFGTVAANYVERATYFKLREVSLSYELPSRLVRSLWGVFQGGRISLSGRNLFTATPYSGLDPEVSNFGNQAIARNIDVTPFPPSRSFFFTLDLRF